MVRSSLVFACYERACRPPTSGGTGGSSPLAGRSLAVQHVASKVNAQSIRSQGFRTDTPAWDRSFGDGVYFSYRGDEKSRKFYQRQGGRAANNSEVVRAGVVLDNPAEFDVKSHYDFRVQAAEKLGGVKAVQARAQVEYDEGQHKIKKILKEELGDEYKKLDDGPVEDMFFWDVDREKANRVFDRVAKEVPQTGDGGHIEHMRAWKNLAQNDKIWVNPKRTSDQYGTIESRMLGNMLRDDGYDGLIINTNRWGEVGGQQLVVFDPKKVSIIASCYSRSCAPPPVGRGGSDTRSRGFDRQLRQSVEGIHRSRSDAVRRAAEGALIESIYSGTTKIYHGSPADIQIGDIIRPTHSPGAQVVAGELPVAFATRHIETAAGFGNPEVIKGQTLKVYEVVPIDKDLRFLPSTEMGVHVASPSGFRVVGVLDSSPVPNYRRDSGIRHRRTQEAIREARTRGRVPRTLKDEKLVSKLSDLVQRREAKRKPDPELDKAIEDLVSTMLSRRSGSLRASVNQPRVPAGSPKGGQWASTVGKVRSVLTDDLRKAPYKGSCNPMTGHCYVASEALYHALGGKEAGWTPHNITHEGSPHWFLKHKDGAIVDPTADQFKTPVPYAKAKGKGFLTRQPSKRAREVLRRANLG